MLRRRRKRRGGRLAFVQHFLQEFDHRSQHRGKLEGNCKEFSDQLLPLSVRLQASLCWECWPFCLVELGTTWSSNCWPFCLVELATWSPNCWYLWRARFPTRSLRAFFVFGRPISWRPDLLGLALPVCSPAVGVVPASHGILLDGRSASRANAIW